MDNLTVRKLTSAIVDAIESMRVSDSNQKLLTSDKHSHKHLGLTRQKAFHGTMIKVHETLKNFNTEEMDSVTAVKLEHIADIAGFYPLTNAQADRDFWIPYRENFVDVMVALSNATGHVDLEPVRKQFVDCLNNLQTHLDMTEEMFHKIKGSKKENVEKTVSKEDQSLSLEEFVTKVKVDAKKNFFEESKNYRGKMVEPLFSQSVIDAIADMKPSRIKSVMFATVTLAEDVHYYMHKTDYGMGMEEKMEESQMDEFITRLNTIKEDNKSVNVLICLERFSKFLHAYAEYESFNNSSEEDYRHMIRDLETFATLMTATVLKEMRK